MTKDPDPGDPNRLDPYPYPPHWFSVHCSVFYVRSLALSFKIFYKCRHIGVFGAVFLPIPGVFKRNKTPTFSETVADMLALSFRIRLPQAVRLISTL